MGGTLWRWWWEVPCGGGDAQRSEHLHDPPQHIAHCHPTGEREGWGGRRGAYVSRSKLSSL